MKYLGLAFASFLLFAALAALPAHTVRKTDFTTFGFKTALPVNFQAPEEKVNLVLTDSRVDSTDATGRALVDAIKSTLQPGVVNFSEGDPDTNDPNSVNIRIISTSLTDTTSSAAVAVVVHTKGQEYSAFLGLMEGVLHKENSDDNASQLLNLAQQAYDVYVQDTVKQ